jgi:hypothetical protein
MRKILLKFGASRALRNRVLWLMVDSDFSKASPRISQNFIAARKLFCYFSGYRKVEEKLK